MHKYFSRCSCNIQCGELLKQNLAMIAVSGNLVYNSHVSVTRDTKWTQTISHRESRRQSTSPQSTGTNQEGDANKKKKKKI